MDNTLVISAILGPIKSLPPLWPATTPFYGILGPKKNFKKFQKNT
jgi:hypothetical protein